MFSAENGILAKEGQTTEGKLWPGHVTAGQTTRVVCEKQKEKNRVFSKPPHHLCWVQTGTGTQRWSCIVCVNIIYAGGRFDTPNQPYAFLGITTTSFCLVAKRNSVIHLLYRYIVWNNRWLIVTCMVTFQRIWEFKFKGSRTWRSVSNVAIFWLLMFLVCKINDGFVESCARYCCICIG